MSTFSSNASRPAHHANSSATAFVNPWPSASAPTWGELAQSSFPLGLYKDEHLRHEKARELKVVKPDWGKASLKDRNIDKATSVIGTWLGHASALVEIPPIDNIEQKSLWLLFDPVFSMRAGPTVNNGVARFKTAPCQVEDLPGCDAVFISHNHYDHLDAPSIRAIVQKFPQAKYFVSLGIKQWMSSMGVPVEQICEMDWWENREYCPEDFGIDTRPASTNQINFRFSCVPAQHNSARSPIDQGRTLWCGWVVERFIRTQDDSSESKATRKGSIYHAGDTGYRRTSRSDVVCPVFQEIGERFGAFDLSFIPIWRGGTLGFFSSWGLRLSHQDFPAAHHASPADAIAIHLDVRSRNTIGIHFGTFVGSENESYEAMIEFAKACDRHSVASLDSMGDDEYGRAGLLDIGDSLAVPTL
ncbi:N-acyl-phosphatidylethanolamine-hydrolyzing phospholipase D [Cladophialophora carrionii]|uniref:N-acyl-phosphatidylethanolamine-hydrolyzing phospholipase D n=1 Tax=Cladophialophora carrionii TaxID=86049 RepID=A0A1C1CI37_9EURO|nr:N-acyl-phosphatidylethanolamine-hydrolyzing phospholipase D [Cladophialophora carrionii]